MSQVQLAVYDLTRGLARSMSGAILGQQIDGIWHTGIVVYGYEYYFGGGIQKSPWGSFAQSNQLPPVQVLDMGTTTKTVRELETYLASIQGQFSMMTYDLIRNNCNNFADTVCNFLVGHGIPNHIVDLPRIVFSTPGGAMLRPMIENMQANIRQQNGQGLDPFAGASAQQGQRFEQQLSESVTSLVMNTMQQNSVLVKAELDEKPLLSKDFGTLAAMEKMLHNLAGPNGEKGSALTEEEHAILTAVVQRLLNESAAKTPDGGNETEGFSINDYLLFEKLIATIPKAQSPALFVLRLMFLHDRTSDFSDLTIVRELVRRLLQKTSQGNGTETSTSFASVPAHVMALCAISNLLAHERGFSSVFNTQPTTDQPAVDSCDKVLNDLIDVILSNLAEDRSEVRQMATALAYNLVLACTQDFVPSGPWKSAVESSDMNAHALQLLCGCLEGLSNEKVSSAHSCTSYKAK